MKKQLLPVMCSSSVERAFFLSKRKIKHKMITAFLTLSTLCLLFLSSCKKDEFETPAAVNIYEALKADGLNFSMLRAAIDRAGLKETLGSNGNITFFAPINQAFIDAGYPNVAAVNAADPKVLSDILRYHLVDRKVSISEINSSLNITANNGKVLLLDNFKFSTKDSLTNVINGAEVISKEIGTTNGNFYAIKRVLMPEGNDILTALKSNGNYSLFVAAINRASQGTTNYNTLLSGTKPYTVFCPTNSSFNSFLGGKYNSAVKINAVDPNVVASELVAYHILDMKYFSYQLPKKPVTLNQSALTTSVSRVLNANNAVTGFRVLVNGFALNDYAANKIASNGIINEVSSVLSQPSGLNLLQLIQSNSNLTFLKAIIDRASTGSTDFNSLLAGSDAKTIFAPTNTALQTEGYNSLSTISLASPTVLADLLNRHIFLGQIYSTSIPAGSTYIGTSLNGLKVVFANGTTYSAQGPNNTGVGTISPFDTISANGVFNIINVVLK
ncbi:fasciclin domain-containing protein [Pedobacter frigiditerrae]|uniref:Fasciclin domain-containing protein n=1 Tax=Pedobacter frigiditerrae TaxID=2530452 RepID=A0A4R0MPP3_9SPHI|nr:fasciclin domain-containing protein [Pedobacter frigiditerrae]TCC88623.1 fasciclin domain-containing protein [Pedobacter frigiditerrae]